jgi:hypothetical protein
VVWHHRSVWPGVLPGRAAFLDISWLSGSLVGMGRLYRATRKRRRAVPAHGSLRPIVAYNYQDIADCIGISREGLRRRGYLARDLTGLTITDLVDFINKQRGEKK